MRAPECFVVMPFGRKRLTDGSGRDYDFDKVYRVIIQRAVREAGLQPVRADERATSALIHTDMFRDLRDRPVVVADLSLDNPNVFYELGVRHVMSPGGTVLMCRTGSALPFDVKLSRVIFYDFDGASLDWEEVERVVKALTLALQEAAKGTPDSPVHALLESVLQAPRAGTGAATAQPRGEDAPDAEPLAVYQRQQAAAWATAGLTIDRLFDAERRSVFGARALAYLWLATEPAPADQMAVARRLANHLNDAQQYRLANRLYERLLAAGALSRGSRLAYASSYSETHPDIAGTDQAFAIARVALDEAERACGGRPERPEDVLAYAECHRRLAGLYQWRWQQTQSAVDLDAAILSFGEAVRYNDQSRRLGVQKHPGFLAQARLKQMLMLRIRDGDPERPDAERHHDAILAITPAGGDDPRAVSYLGWFQAIALADRGDADGALRKTLDTLARDAGLQSDPECWEIGRRQYVLLRRFIEQFQAHLLHHPLQARIAQSLLNGAAP